MNEGKFIVKIRDFRGYYITRAAQVFSNRSGKLVEMTQPTNGKGYKRVYITHYGHRHKVCVHRLVLRAFVGPGFDGAECDHLDNCRDNNAPGNLEWVTHAENIRRVIERNPQAYKKLGAATFTKR